MRELTGSRAQGCRAPGRGAPSCRPPHGNAVLGSGPATDTTENLPLQPQLLTPAIQKLPFLCLFPKAVPAAAAGILSGPRFPPAAGDLPATPRSSRGASYSSSRDQATSCPGWVKPGMRCHGRSEIGLFSPQPTELVFSDSPKAK